MEVEVEKSTEYEVVVKITCYANSQGDAVTELEKRLKAVPASQDMYAVVVRETSAKRMGAAK